MPGQNLVLLLLLLLLFFVCFCLCGLSRDTDPSYVKNNYRVQTLGAAVRTQSDATKRQKSINRCQPPAWDETRQVKMKSWPG